MTRGAPISPQQAFHWETLWHRCLGGELVGRDGPFISLALESSIDIERWRRTLTSVAVAHPGLRTVFSVLGPEPLTTVEALREPPLEHLSLGGLTRDRADAVVSRLVDAERSTTFDLRRGPLWRCIVVDMPGDRAVIVFHFCHLIVDGGGLLQLLELVFASYAGGDVSVAGLGDHVEELSPQELAGRRDYWRGVVSGTLLDFPTDFPASPPALYSSAVARFAHPEDVVARAAARARTTPYVVHLAAYGVVAAMMSDSRKVVFGSSIAREDLRDSAASPIGYFLDPILVPVTFTPDTSWSDLVQRVAGSLEAARENVLPFRELAMIANPRFLHERPWPFSRMYDGWVRGRLFDTAQGHQVSLGGLELRLHSFSTGYSDLTLAEACQGEALSRAVLPSLYLDDAAGATFHCEYNRAVFRPATIERLARYLVATVGRMHRAGERIEVAWREIECDVAAQESRDAA